MLRILGIDPGTRLTGFGCIDSDGRKTKHIGHGTLRLDAKKSLGERLVQLHIELTKIIHEFSPQICVVEKVFFAKNVSSALKLGHARGVAILSGVQNGLQFFEYSPTEVKQAVSGYGLADKVQVAKMVQLFIGRIEFETLDATDALALAVCHAHRASNRIHAMLRP